MNAIRRVVMWIPDWPTTSLVIDAPPGAPAATAHRGRITVATMPARRLGVRTAMPVSTAQYVCTDLLVFPHDPIRQAAAFEPLAQVFDSLAASVVCLRPGLAWAPAAGPARWVGSEEALAEALVEAVVTHTGAECQVGIATGTLASLEAARQGIIVPAHDTAQFLAEVPLTRATQALPPVLAQDADHALEILAQLGVRTCADLVNLGRSSMITRFGRAGEVLWSLCTGADPQSRGMTRVIPTLEVSTDFDPPALELDSMIMGLRRLAEELSDELWKRGASSHTLTVWMRTESGETRERTWSSVDCSNSSDVVDRVRWQLRGWTDTAGSAHGHALAPDSGLAEVGLIARDLTDAPPGAALWGRTDADQRATRAALRLQSLLGEEGVLAPHLQGGHDPRSRIHYAPWGSPVEGLAPTEGEWSGGVDRAPATILDTPCPVELWAAEDGAPGDSWGPAPGGQGGQGTLRLIDEGDADALRSHQGGEAQFLGPGGMSRRHRVHVDPRGHVDAQVLVLIPVPAGDYRLPGGLSHGEGVQVWVSAGPWPIRGRWWEGADGPRAPRAYLRVGWQGGCDLLLVQRHGTWSIEGIYD